MTEEDLTEKMLTTAVNDWADELKKFKPGDPAVIPFHRELAKAKKELDDYLKSKKKKKKK